MTTRICKKHSWLPVLAGAFLIGTIPPGASPAAAAGEPNTPRAAEVPVTSRYWSAPPALLTPSRRSAPVAPSTPPRGSTLAGSAAAPTRGTVTGRLVNPTGRPLVGVLVSGVRFSDLRGSFDQDENPSPQTRTGPDGRFRLPQPTERYLIRACDTAEGFTGCDEDPAVKRFTPTYVGPDGVRDSWLTQTRMFRPTSATRALGAIRVRPSAVLNGTFTDGAHRSVRLLRANGTTAASSRTDDAGRYRFEVAPGRYRVEVDRIEGLRTVDTKPGFRSRLLHLTSRHATVLSFDSKPAASIYGRVTAAGEPVAEQFVAITDQRGRFAAGVGTDADGRYSLDALKPGRYTLSTPAAVTPFLPASRTFTIDTDVPTRADLELADGARIVLTPTDTTSSNPDSTIIVELRNADGTITKAAGGASGDGVSFSGLAPGRYQVVARRADDSPVESPDDNASRIMPSLPWAERIVIVSGTETIQLGTVALDRATLDLAGIAPPHARVRITPLPDVPYLRKDFTEGSGVTGLSVTWLTNADASGHYEAYGLVPGRYFVAVTASLVERDDGATVYRGNIAATSTTLTVTANTRTADFTAPRGAKVTGRFRYAATHRPAIAPFGFEVRDHGAQSRLFPLLSKPQQFRGGFTVDRLHRGRADGTVVDIQEVLNLADFQAEELPTNLTDSASTEPATPYWFTSTHKKFRITPGRTTDIGWVNLRVHY